MGIHWLLTVSHALFWWWDSFCGKHNIKLVNWVSILLVVFPKHQKRHWPTSECWVTNLKDGGGACLLENIPG
jgi:hypothetical protein